MPEQHTAEIPRGDKDWLEHVGGNCDPVVCRFCQNPGAAEAYADARLDEETDK